VAAMAAKTSRAAAVGKFRAKRDSFSPRLAFSRTSMRTGKVALDACSERSIVR
jgi:hypothetical protein